MDNFEEDKVHTSEMDNFGNNFKLSYLTKITIESKTYFVNSLNNNSLISSTPPLPNFPNFTLLFSIGGRWQAYESTKVLISMLDSI